MKNIFFQIVENGSIIFSTLTGELIALPEQCSNGSNRCNIQGTEHLYIKKETNYGYIFICSSDRTITRRILGHYFDAIEKLYTVFDFKIKDVKNSSINNLRRLQHNVTNYNAAIYDGVTGLISLDDMQQDWNNVVAYTEQIVSKKNREASVALLKTFKNSTLINAELTIFDLIAEPNPHLEIHPHGIHKVVKLSFQPYFLEFLDRSIHLQCANSYNKVLVDYPSLSVILGHIWNNAIKYAKDHSSISIEFSNTEEYVRTEINMTSLYIEKEERNLIMQEGVSGIWAKRLEKDGHGIGMFYIQRLIELNNGRFCLVAGDAKTYYNSIPYANNKFVIDLPIYKP